jgi:hypothetical protein
LDCLGERGKWSADFADAHPTVQLSTPQCYGMEFGYGFSVLFGFYLKKLIKLNFLFFLI